MCGRYSFFDTDKLYERFDITKGKQKLNDRYNVAPGQLMPVITQHIERNSLATMQWGLIPGWTRDIKDALHLINARSETLNQKPSFREPLKKQRCLVPANGFFEWKKEINGKIPYYIRPKSGQTIALAGLYDKWLNPANNENIYTYTIITTSASKGLSSIHARMPAIIPLGLESDWLNTAEQDPTTLQQIIKSPSSETMEYFPVSTLVNKPEHDSPEILEPISQEKNKTHRNITKNNVK